MQNGVKVLTNGGKGPAHQHGRLVLPATISDTECFARCRRPRKAAFNPGVDGCTLAKAFAYVWNLQRVHVKCKKAYYKDTEA